MYAKHWYSDNAVNIGHVCATLPDDFQQKNNCILLKDRIAIEKRSSKNVLQDGFIDPPNLLIKWSSLQLIFVETLLHPFAQRMTCSHPAST